METIFVSYRRDDRPNDVGRICDRLMDRLGKERIYRDVDDIPLGVDYVEHMTNALRQSAFVLVAIGPEWVRLVDASGARRLDDPDDAVRLEVRTALATKKQVIPMLVGGASMPRRDELPEDIRLLVQRNGLAIRRDPDFDRDINALLQALHTDGSNKILREPDRLLAPTPFSTQFGAWNVALGSALGWGLVGGLLSLETGLGLIYHVIFEWEFTDWDTLVEAAVLTISIILVMSLVGWFGGALLGAVSSVAVRSKRPAFIARELRRMGFAWTVGTGLSALLGGISLFFLGDVLDATDPYIRDEPTYFAWSFFRIVILPLIGVVLGAISTSVYMSRQMGLRAEELGWRRRLGLGLLWFIMSLFIIFLPFYFIP